MKIQIVVPNQVLLVASLALAAVGALFVILALG
jgi:hypothetical protein